MKYIKEITYCTFCPKLCRFVCPACEAGADESRTPAFRASVLYMWSKGEELPEELLHRIYSCLLCRACKEVCEHEIDVSIYTIEGRAHITKRGLQPEGSKRLLELMKANKSPFQRVSKESEPSSETVFFPGCTYLNFYPHTVEKVKNMLLDAGVRFSIFEGCCGFPLYWMGYLDEFRKHTSYLKKRLKKVKKVISMCPHCTWYMREQGFEVEDVLETLTEFVERTGKRRIQGEYFYHDPCYRVRYLGEEDVSRFLLSTFLESPPKEFLFSKKETSCCGGLMMEFVEEKLTQMVAMSRLKECEGTPLIVSCPQCRKRFENEGKETYDILEFMYSVIYE